MSTNSEQKNNMDIYRSMPESMSAEAAVLGSMLISPDCISEVVAMLKTEDFYRHENRLFFEALVSLYEKIPASSIDAVLLRDEFVRMGTLDEIGGVEYINKILDSICSAANFKYYAGIVKEKSLLRSLISITGQILDNAYTQQFDTYALLDDAERMIFSVTNRNLQNETELLSEQVNKTCAQIEDGSYYINTGTLSGFAELDELTGGFQAGDMIIIAGRPSMGKTSLALNIVEKVGVVDKFPIAFFSMEMSKKQLSDRFISSLSQLSIHNIRKSRPCDRDMLSIRDSRDAIRTSPVYIDDTTSLSPLTLRAKARRLKSNFGIKALVVDYLQLMYMQNKKTDSRQQEITLISSHIKSLARELDIPVIVLSQLNRAPEARVGHVPRMSDLRESGSIEQDADLVILLHREDYYHVDDDDYEPDNVAQIIIAKHRNGPTGLVKLVFRSEYSQFRNYAHFDSDFKPF